MAVNDLQAFIRERLQSLDEAMDVSPGSPADTQVIQPIVRRIGTDPYTVDTATFLSDRLQQAFPDMAVTEGDGITDLLVKPAALILDPIVRETFRIRNSQSFSNPDALTTEEAEALGANLFSERNKGSYAKGVGRIYYAQPRTISITPINFFTSKGGLHFFPDGQQSITLEEMLLNLDGSLYYFDVNLIAESPGVAYRIDTGELINVANMEGTAKVTNLRRFRLGEDAETATEFIDRVQQELTERSLVTVRGIGALVPGAFPEVTRMAVVGFGDPEMQRDVLSGGGLGGVVVGGTTGQTILDGEATAATRRFQPNAGVDLTTVLDSAAPGDYVLTVFSAFSGPPYVRDFTLQAISASYVDTVAQEMTPLTTGRSWSVRKRELTLSNIPGGILYPDTEQGTVVVPTGEVHVGGMADISVRGSGFDSSTLVLENVVDANPAASGSLLTCGTIGVVTLGDLVLGTNYAVGDATYSAIAAAKEYGFTLQIRTGPNAGSYRVIDAVQIASSSPLLTLDAAVPVVVGNFLWQLVDVIDVDLADPKDTKVSGSDLQSVQHTDTLTAAGSTDFLALGVGTDCTLRILSGLDAGDYAVKSLPAFNEIRVDRALTSTAGSLAYTIFKANGAGGVQLPLVRVVKVELLDTSGQPIGATIPYAKPVDVQSRAFENPGRGMKVDITDGMLGILSLVQPVGGFVIGGLTLTVSFASGYTPISVTFSAGNKTAAAAVTELNAAAALVLGANAVLATVVGSRVGIIPVLPGARVSTGTALTALFGGVRTAGDIRSAALLTDWASVSPAIDQDDLDVAQVLDGSQIGFYGRLHFGPTGVLWAGYVDATSNAVDFAPEVGRHLQVGSRSIGSARCYFLGPTSIEFNASTRFTARLADGGTVRFLPDPTVDSTRVPAYPSTSLPKDGVSTGTSFTSASQNFILSGRVPGDELLVRYVPIIGSLALASSVVVALLTVVVSVNGGADQTIIFANDDTTIPVANVTRAGVVSQINTQVGRPIAKLGSTNRLEFESDVEVTVRGTGTANAALGLGITDQTTLSPHLGTYTITYVTEHSFTVSPAFPAGTYTREAFEIRRPGTQRVSSTQMAEQSATGSLYYCDVELVSEGSGDRYNIDSDVQLTVDGYRSDGYYLSTADENLTFSSAERPTLHVSRSILEVGSSDDPANATQLTGQNLEVTYDRSTLVADVQNFIMAETERVVCSNPLARHLIPHFVRFDFEYTGGSQPSVVVADMETYIRKLYPSDWLEVGDLVNIAYQRGATGVTNPIDLIAVVYGYDRSVWAQRSQNALNTGRLAAFVADTLNVNRKSG